MDEKFVINNGYGDENITFEVLHYAPQYGGGLALSMNCADGEYKGEPFGTLTTNLGDRMEPFHAFIDTNNMPGGPALIKSAGIGEPTGRTQRSGYCVYPEYVFDEHKLKELDPEGTERYKDHIMKMEQKVHKVPEKQGEAQTEWVTLTDVLDMEL